MMGFLRLRWERWGGFGKEEPKFHSDTVGLKPFRCPGGNGRFESGVQGQSAHSFRPRALR